MFKLLSDGEFYSIIEQIPNADVATLEQLYNALMEDILRRATSEQREKLYEVFSKWYKIKCKLKGKPVNNSLLNKDEWVNVGKPYYLSSIEEHWIKNNLEKIHDIDGLEKYYEFVVDNVFPRAEPKAIESINEAFVHRQKQIEHSERLRREMKEIMESEEYKNRPEVGTRVTMEINGEVMCGTVINRAYTTPEVQVRWDSGEVTWIEPRHLKW